MMQEIEIESSARTQKQTGRWHWLTTKTLPGISSLTFVALSYATAPFDAFVNTAFNNLASICSFFIWGAKMRRLGNKIKNYLKK